MFDLAWSEIALIGVVALIAIGPKDLPIAIKAVAEMMKKARRMASEFQTHVDEMVREADLTDVRNQFNDIRNMDIKGKILGAVDGDGSIRRTMNETTTFNAPPPPVPPSAGLVTQETPAESVMDETRMTEHGVGEHGARTLDAPAFIPPAYVDPRSPPPAPQAIAPNAVAPVSAVPHASHEPATPSTPHA